MVGHNSLGMRQPVGERSINDALQWVLSNKDKFNIDSVAIVLFLSYIARSIHVLSLQLEHLLFSLFYLPCASSFDIEEFGVDFKILEGRNMIGSKSSSEITIQDPQVSSVHALILCRKDRFLLSDEMSSNGTTINGEDLSPRDPSELNDGDEIKIGNTTLLFKKAFK